MGNKVLILGSTGLIGHQIYEYLRKNSDFLLSNTSYRKQLNDETVLLDARNESDFVNYIKIVRPNYIINCIGVLISESDLDPLKASFLNANLPHKLAKLADKINAKLIHMSTDCVFSGNKKLPYLEDDFKDGNTNYARFKNFGEVISNSHLTIRTSVVGPEFINDGDELFHWFMSQSNNIEGYTKSIWSGVTTIELAKAVKYFIENNTVGLYHLTNNLSISKYDLLKLFLKYTNKDIEVIMTEGKVTNKSFIDSRKELNYSIPEYNLMIKDMIVHIRNNHNVYKHYSL